MQRPLTVLISGVGIAGPALAYRLLQFGHRPVLVERTSGLRAGGHAVDIRSAPLEVDFADRTAAHHLLQRHFSGIGWETARLVDALPDAHDFYFDEMSQVRLPRWSARRVALLGDAAFGPSPMSGQGTSLALIGAFLLAHHIAVGPDLPTALASWETGFRANVEQNQRLATHGMATLLPASRLAIFARNQSLRVLPGLARFGRGFGGRIERASRAVTLPHP